MPFGADEAACQSCAEIYSASDLDRYLWCPICRREVRRRGALWARAVGLIVSLGVALYINITIHPSRRFLIFYALILVLTYVLTSRITLAVVQGVYRARGSVGGPPSSADGG